MTKLQRVKDIIIALILAFFALGMIFAPQDNYIVLLYIIAAWMSVQGISTIFYYFTMARYMVGGKVSLYTGVILLDFGLLTFSLTNVPYIYILLYLVGMLGFSGAVRILRTLETKKNGSKHWKLKLFHGVVDILMAVFCIINIKFSGATVMVFGFSVLYSSIMRIITACRKSTLVVIE